MLLRNLPKYLTWLQEQGYRPYSLEVIQVGQNGNWPWVMALSAHHQDGRHSNGGCDYLVEINAGAGNDEHYAQVAVVPHYQGDEDPPMIDEANIVRLEWRGDENPAVTIVPQRDDWGADIVAAA